MTTLIYNGLPLHICELGKYFARPRDLVGLVSVNKTISCVVLYMYGCLIQHLAILRPVCLAFLRMLEFQFEKLKFSLP